MINHKQVPTGVVAVFDAVWEMTRCTDKAIAAALNAWPGMQTGSDDGGMTLSGIYLPLTEKPDA